MASKLAKLSCLFGAAAGSDGFLQEARHQHHSLNLAQLSKFASIGNQLNSIMEEASTQSQWTTGTITNLAME